MGNPYLSLPELADELNVSRKVIYGLRYRREGPPAVRIGRELRFSRVDVDRWLENRTEVIPS